MSTATDMFRLKVDRLVGELCSVEVDVRGMTPDLIELDQAELPETNAQLMLAVRAIEEAQDRLRRAMSAATYHPACVCGAFANNMDHAQRCPRR